MTTAPPFRSTQVSVVVPTRDRPRLLARTLLAAIAQVDVHTELVVVDDGSYVPVTEQLSDSALECVRLVRHDRSRGVCEARNTGIRAARGEWIAFLDDDDLWAPNKLERQLSRARAAGADLAYAGGVDIGVGGEMIGVQDAPSEAGLYERLLQSNVIPYAPSNILARARLLAKVGPFDRRLQILGDWDMALRLAKSASAVAVHELLIGYILHGANMHSRESGHSYELSVLSEKHAAEREAHGVLLDRASWLRWRIRGHQLANDYDKLPPMYRQLARITRAPEDVARGLVATVGGRRGMSAISQIRHLVRPPLEPPAWLEQALNPPGERLRAMLRTP